MAGKPKTSKDNAAIVIKFLILFIASLPIKKFRAMSPDQSGLLRLGGSNGRAKKKNLVFTRLLCELYRLLELNFNHVVYPTFHYVWLIMNVRLDDIAERVCRADAAAAHDFAVKRIEFVGGFDDARP